MITERHYQQRILDYATYTRWTSYHTHDSRRSQPGFPDLVLTRPPRLVFAELKSQRGKVTVAQQEWLTRLRECGAECYVWRPDDWTDVVEVLK